MSNKNPEPAEAGVSVVDNDLASQVQIEALSKLREFLEGCWQWTHHVHYDTGFKRSEPKPEIASTFMCRHTARVLLELLEDVEPGWRLGGGTMTTKDGREPQPHWWIESDRTIVDLTADQFGWSGLTIAAVDDERYVRQEQACHKRWINGLSTVVAQWSGKSSRDWMEEDPRFQAIAQKSGQARQAFCEQWRVGMLAKPENQGPDEAAPLRKTRRLSPL